jgi:pseudaminic acid cytidylyltransferase
MNILAIIPARGGSKRIPKKNIKDFLGKPIISYSIQAAIDAGLFNEIMVSTDDKEIAEISLLYGASVPFYRSESNSNDFATTFDVIEEVTLEYKKNGKEYDYVCCIYPCAPFCSSLNLRLAFELLKKSDFDSVFPVVSFNTPIQKSLKTINQRIEMNFPEFRNYRSQDLPISYFDAGQFYWLNVKNILKNKMIFSENSGCIILDELNAQDIDNEIDWKIAELKYSLKN